MSVKTINLNHNLYEYFQRTSLREPPVLSQLRRETQRMAGAEMQISPEQGQFISLLLEILGARKTLDIGTFTGYSALVAALSMPTDCEVVTCDIDRSHTEVALKYFEMAGVHRKIRMYIGPALDSLQSLIDKGESSTFDFSFIDADKANYDDYYEKSLVLLRRGGLIAIDNVLWSGKVADPTINDTQTCAIRYLNTKLLYDERVTLSMVPIGDGLTLARKR